MRTTLRAKKLGSIDDLMIDKIIGPGLARCGSRVRRIFLAWATIDIRSRGESAEILHRLTEGGYIVPLDKERLRSAPKYSETSVPVYDRDYGTRINSYYDNY